MDFSITKEEVFQGAEQSLINTRQKRFQNISFSAELKDGYYVLTSEQGKLNIDIFDEIALYVIAKFRFAPMWLIKQYYEDIGSKSVIGSDIVSNKIKSFIDFGLIYEFPSAVAVFLMPTNRLASLFDIELGNFTDPPYNTLTHTISEEKIMLDCMSGKAPYLKDVPHVPFVSNLGLGKYEQGTVVIPESEYSLRSTFVKDNLQLLNDQEASLAREVVEGKIVTTVDLRQLQLIIHKKIDKDIYDWKIPDLSILSPRKLDEEGLALPQSVALEVELSNKGWKSYKRLLNLYWDNLKFGYCIYLTPSQKIKDELMKAIDKLFEEHEKDGISQTCEFSIFEFEVPYDHSQLILGNY